MSSSHASLNAAAAQITPKMLNDINNLSESMHKTNHSNHSQMIEQQQKVLPLSEDPRTLQLALELSLVGLSENQNSYVQPLPIVTQNDYELGPLNVVSTGFARTETHNSVNNMPLPPTTTSCLLMPSAGVEDRSKKSQNMTECVPVPSSEHVAEIVGRQGCKIKALRAKTNTYIKTPVRGEEPVFVVTGRKEDVNKAKREILSAADHFSLIRASRKPSMEDTKSGITGIPNSGSELTVGVMARSQSGPPCLPGQITIQVRVPYRVVGLVVGPKGATIKHIQQETQTYIVTPSREKEPIFEVTGLPENVETARKQIEAHIALRTGSNAQASENGTESLDSNEFATLHSINTLSQILNDDLNTDILSSIYKNDISPAIKYSENPLGVIDSVNISISNSSVLEPGPVHSLANNLPNSDIVHKTSDKIFSAGSISEQPSKLSYLYRKTSFCPPTSLFTVSTTSSSTTQCPSSLANVLTRSCSSASSTASTKSTNNSANSTNSVNTPPELLSIWRNLNESIDIDEGIGDSPNIWNFPATNITVASNCSPTASISPTDSLLAEHSLANNQKICTSSKESCPNATNSSQLQRQQRTPLAQTNTEKVHRDCFVCNEREVTTALVPCGHNMFCMNCANQICVSMESICPVCHSIVYHAMRILA